MSNDANKVKNFQMLDMLKQREKEQASKIQERMLQRAGDLRSGVLPTPLRVQPLQRPAPAGYVQQTHNLAAKTQALESDLDKVQAQVIPFTGDEVEWLNEVTKRNGLPSMSGAVHRLIDWANKEPPEAKKKLFLVIRCRRCSAGAKGGIKTDNEIELLRSQWQWLENVQGRCQHASVGKTIRIIADFYMALCKGDADFEQKILRAGCAGKSARLQDAVGSVDISCDKAHMNYIDVRVKGA